DHDVGVEEVDQSGQPSSNPACRFVQAVKRFLFAGFGGGEYLEHGGATTARVAPARLEHRFFANLGLEAAVATATAQPAVRIDDHVAELAGVALRAGNQVAVDDDAPAHADFTGKVDQMIDAAARAADVFGQAAEVAVVAHTHLGGDVEPFGEHLAERRRP